MKTTASSCLSKVLRHSIYVATAALVLCSCSCVKSIAAHGHDCGTSDPTEEDLVATRVAENELFGKPIKYDTYVCACFC
jgi:hypothetical protein